MYKYVHTLMSFTVLGIVIDYVVGCLLFLRLIYFLSPVLFFSFPLLISRLFGTVSFFSSPPQLKSWHVPIIENINDNKQHTPTFFCTLFSPTTFICINSRRSVLRQWSSARVEYLAKNTRTKSDPLWSRCLLLGSSSHRLGVLLWICASS